MADLVRCPTGHFYDATQHSACPYCEGIYPVKSQQNNRSRTPWIITVISMIAFGVLFVDWSNKESRNSNVRRELREVSNKVSQYESEIIQYKYELESYQDVKKAFGYGSEHFYAKFPVIAIKPDGTIKNLPVFCDLNTTIRFELGSNTSLSAEWDKNWNDHWTNLKLSSKRRGLDVIKFSNDANQTTFIVTVVAK